MKKAWLIPLILLSFVSIVLGALGDTTFNPESWLDEFLKNLTHNWFFGFFNSLFIKLSFLFYLVFGMSYEPSNKMVIVAALWVYFTFLFKNLFATMFYQKLKLRKMQYLGIGAGITIIFALSTGLVRIYDGIFWILEKFENPALQYAVGAAIAFGFAVLYVVISSIERKKLRIDKKRNALAKDRDVKELKERVKRIEQEKESEEEEDEGEDMGEIPDFEEPEFDKA